MFNNLTTKTMDKTLISGKDRLFAYCVTDGMLDDMGEERRASLLLTITEIKESMQTDIYPPKLAERTR